jgi:hypothetical protein
MHGTALAIPLCWLVPCLLCILKMTHAIPAIHNPNRDCKVSMTHRKAWTKCSAQCGGGSQTQDWFVIHSHTGTGKRCPEPSLRVCNTEDCTQADCSVGEWGAWGQCTNSCGIGTRLRRRKPIKIDKGCPPPRLKESTVCNTQECPLDCQLSVWSQWGSCHTYFDSQRQCFQDMKTRTRHVLLRHQYGGKPCPPLLVRHKAGCLVQKIHEPKYFDAPACPAEPLSLDNYCKLSAWSEWGGCVKYFNSNRTTSTCGFDSGVRTRVRHVLQQALGGNSCKPPLRIEKQCSKQGPCYGKSSNTALCGGGASAGWKRC